MHIQFPKISTSIVGMSTRPHAMSKILSFNQHWITEDHTKHNVSLDCAPQRTVPFQIVFEWVPDPENGSNYPYADLPFFGSILERLHRMTTTWHLSRSNTYSSREHFHTEHHWDKNRPSSSLHIRTKLHYWGWPTIYVCVCVWNSVSASSWGQWTHSRPHCAPGPMRMRRTREGVCVQCPSHSHGPSDQCCFVLPINEGPRMSLWCPGHKTRQCAESLQLM